MKTPIRDYMSRPLVTVSPDATLADALVLMNQNRIRHLVVMEGETLAGVISRRDIQVGMALFTLALVPVRRLMRRAPRIFDQETDLQEVLTAMADTKIGSAVVVDTAGKPIGIFTAIDALSRFAEYLGGPA